MHLQGVEVHRRELVAQKSEAMVQHGPSERRFPAARLRDEHHGRAPDEHGSVHEIEVAAHLLQLDADVSVECREKRTVVSGHERSLPLPGNVVPLRRSIAADGVVESHVASVPEHLAVGGEHEALRRGIPTTDTNTSTEDP